MLDWLQCKLFVSCGHCVHGVWRDYSIHQSIHQFINQSINHLFDSGTTPI